MFRLFPDIAIDPVTVVTHSPSMIWVILGVVAGAVLFAAALITILVVLKKKKKEGK